MVSGTAFSGAGAEGRGVVEGEEDGFEFEEGVAFSGDVGDGAGVLGGDFDVHCADLVEMSFILTFWELVGSGLTYAIGT